MLENIWTGLKNIRYWLPVIWSDRDWDYNFLLIILAHKLRSIQDFFESDKTILSYEHCKKAAGNARECAMLAERLIEYTSQNAAFAEHETKWGKSELIIDDETHEIHFIYKSFPDRESSIKASKELRELLDKAQEQEEKDKKDLFSNLNENLYSWWD